MHAQRSPRQVPAIASLPILAAMAPGENPEQAMQMYMGATTVACLFYGGYTAMLPTVVRDDCTFLRAARNLLPPYPYIHLPSHQPLFLLLLPPGLHRRSVTFLDRRELGTFSLGYSPC